MTTVRVVPGRNGAKPTIELDGIPLPAQEAHKVFNFESGAIDMLNAMEMAKSNRSQALIDKVIDGKSKLMEHRKELRHVCQLKRVDKLIHEAQLIERLNAALAKRSKENDLWAIRVVSRERHLGSSIVELMN